MYFKDLIIIYYEWYGLVHGSIFTLCHLKMAVLQQSEGFVKTEVDTTKEI